jgi:hypothetical protein
MTKTGGIGVWPSTDLCCHPGPCSRDREDGEHAGPAQTAARPASRSLLQS